jgi:hypothetical protein
MEKPAANNPVSPLCLKAGRYHRLRAHAIIWAASGDAEFKLPNTSDGFDRWGTSLLWPNTRQVADRSDKSRGW